MQELIDAALTVSTLPLTLLLGVVGLYWLSVLLGFLDIDLLDGDFDFDTDGFFGSILGFGDAPFMVGFSLVIFFAWAIAVPSQHYLQFSGSMAWLSLLPILITAYVLARLTALPIGRFFSAFNHSHAAVDQVEGKMCTLLYETNNGVSSQGRIDTQSSPVIINIRTRPGQSLPPGGQALVIEKSVTGDFYYVESLEELER